MEKQIEIVEGTVERIALLSDDYSYAVVDLRIDNDQCETVVGNLGKIVVGEQLHVEGEYSHHPKFGKQFTASYCVEMLPNTAKNIEKYLASGVIEGIGPALAKKIVSVFGEDTMSILERAPMRLSEVKGVSTTKCKKIAQNLHKVFALRTLTSFLHQYNIKSMYAMRVYNKHSVDAIDVIKQNPYILCEEGINLDFETADQMAFQLNFKGEDKCRIIAFIKNLLRTASNEGNTCLPIDDLCAPCCEKLDIRESSFYDAYNYAVEECDLFNYIHGPVEDVFLPDFYRAEDYIADRLNIMMSFSFPYDQDFDSLINNEENKSGIKYAKHQRQAINTAISRGIMVLTGGPGTGKTTTLNAIISLFEKMGEEVFLAAPTGRAAKRMTELTGRQAQTIHRLLGVTFDTGDVRKFAHDEDNPLECDVIVIDEMSMVDCLLFESLLRALPLGCKLIMVGDFNQLPSVGAGNVLEDIINSQTVPTVILTEIFRQAQSSLIVTNSHCVVRGEMPELGRRDNDFFFFESSNPDAISSAIVELTANRLPKAYDYSPIDDIQVISPTRRGSLGSIELNNKLQNVLNPPSPDKKEYKGINYIYREGDKVMQIRNNYDIEWKKGIECGSGVFNGDIGIITNIDPRLRVAVINFDGRIAEYKFEMLAQVELAYAMTVHKSQGCEFEAIIMPVYDAYHKLCYRSLLYTAITRAKKLVILIGSTLEIQEMVANEQRSKRNTCLKWLLRKEE